MAEAGSAELVQALYPAQQSLQREINPVLYVPAEFRRHARSGDAFVRQFLDRPNIIPNNGCAITIADCWVTHERPGRNNIATFS